MYGHGVGSWFWVLEKVRTHHWPWLLLSVVEKNVQQILGLLVNYSVPKLRPFCWQSYVLCSVVLWKNWQPTAYCITDCYYCYVHLGAHLFRLLLLIVLTCFVFFSYGSTGCFMHRQKGPEERPLPTKYKHLERSPLQLIDRYLPQNELD